MLLIGTATEGVNDARKHVCAALVKAEGGNMQLENDLCDALSYLIRVQERLDRALERIT